MSEATPTRPRRRLALVLALLAALGLAGASGAVVWRRARTPWRTFQLPPGRYVVWLTSDPELLLVAHFGPGDYSHTWDAVSLDTRLAVRKFEDVAEISPRGIVRLLPDGGLELVDPSTGAARPLLASYGAVLGEELYFFATWLSVSPTGDRVAVETSTNAIEVRSALGVTPPRTVPLAGSETVDPMKPLTFAPHTSLTFSPRGDLLAAGEEGKLVNARIEPKSITRVWTLEDPEAPPRVVENFLGFTRSGDVLVGPPPVLAGTEAELRVESADGSSRLVGRALDYTFRLSASGERLATLEAARGAPQVVVHSTETGAELRRIPTVSASKVLHFMLSPGGDRVAIVRDDGSVEVWEIPP